MCPRHGVFASVVAAPLGDCAGEVGVIRCPVDFWGWRVRWLRRRFVTLGFLVFLVRVPGVLDVVRRQV